MPPAGAEELRVSDMVLVGLITACSTLAAVAITLIGQGWRDHAARDDTLRQQRVERAKGAFRVALEGAHEVVQAAIGIGQP